MNVERLIALYERVADAPDAVLRLRRFILELAVRGKLVPPDAGETIARLDQGRTHSELPFDVPPTWRWVTVGDELELLNGMAFKPTDWVASGLRIVRIQNLNNPDAPFNFCQPEMARDRSLIDDGSFLISWSGTPGTSFGAFIWNRGPAVLNQHIFRCDFKTANFNPPFLRLAVNGRLDEMIAKAHGGVGLQHITKGKLEAMLLPLPPLVEQRRIVAKVDELMALLDRLEAARHAREAMRDRLAAATLARLTAPDTPADEAAANARFALNTLPALTTRPDQIKALRQTILNLAVRGKLVDQDPAEESASVVLRAIAATRAGLISSDSIPRPKPSNRDEGRTGDHLPPSWEMIALGDVANLVTSGSRGWAEFYSEEGPGFVRAQNIRFGRLLLDDLAHVQPPKNSEGARTQVEKGDLLIVITGAGVTNPAMLDRDIGEAYVSQHVGLVRPTSTALSPWLLLCLMADDGGRAELTECAYGSGKPGLNLDNLRSLSVPMAPLAEQHRIVAKVEALMALCDQLETALTTANTTRTRLLEALLHEALTQADLKEAA